MSETPASVNRRSFLASLLVAPVALSAFNAENVVASAVPIEIMKRGNTLVTPKWVTDEIALSYTRNLKFLGGR